MVLETPEPQKQCSRAGAVRSVQKRQVREVVLEMELKWSPEWLRLELPLGTRFGSRFRTPPKPLSDGTNPPRGTQGAASAKKGVPKWTPLWVKKSKNKL